MECAATIVGDSFLFVHIVVKVFTSIRGLQCLDREQDDSATLTGDELSLHFFYQTAEGEKVFMCFFQHWNLTLLPTAAHGL